MHDWTEEEMLEENIRCELEDAARKEIEKLQREIEAEEEEERVREEERRDAIRRARIEEAVREYGPSAYEWYDWYD